MKKVERQRGRSADFLGRAWEGSRTWLEGGDERDEAGERRAIVGEAADWAGTLEANGRTLGEVDCIRIVFDVVGAHAGLGFRSIFSRMLVGVARSMVVRVSAVMVMTVPMDGQMHVGAAVIVGGRTCAVRMAERSRIRPEDA